MLHPVIASLGAILLTLCLNRNVKNHRWSDSSCALTRVRTQTVQRTHRHTKRCHTFRGKKPAAFSRTSWIASACVRQARPTIAVCNYCITLPVSLIYIISSPRGLRCLVLGHGLVFILTQPIHPLCTGLIFQKGFEVMSWMALWVSVHNGWEMTFQFKALKSMFSQDPVRFIPSVKVVCQKHFVVDVDAGTTGGAGSKSALFL